MKLDLEAVEETAKLLYIRALKVLPDDIKEGFGRLEAMETDATGKSILATMVKNIDVAEETDNLLCQDTGIPIYNVNIGRNVDLGMRIPFQYGGIWVWCFGTSAGRRIDIKPIENSRADQIRVRRPPMVEVVRFAQIDDFADESIKLLLLLFMKFLLLLLIFDVFSNLLFIKSNC